MKGSLIIFTAPSGAGKTTIVKYLLSTHRELSFSVSATTRKKRPGEVDGKDYYFLTADEFRQKIKNKELLEWEEVYPDTYYGTLRSEVERLLKEGKHVLFDIDVKGAIKLKQEYKNNAIVIFVKPPSEEVLTERLKSRNTEDPESMKERVKRAKKELTYANQFDRVIINDQLDHVIKQAEELIQNFINNKL